MPSPGRRLVLYGPAQLLHDDALVPLRKKGLALLYLLALDGAMRRERAAELLWGHRDAANNLRVELYRLRSALAAIGLGAFPNAQDPLRLPDGIELDRAHRDGDGAPLEGLDDLARGLQAWLEAQRFQLEHEQVEPNAALRRDLVERVAREIRAPFLIVLRGAPGSGRYAFLEALARRLELPLLHGVAAGGRALRVLDPQVTDPRKVVEEVLRQRSGIWALQISTFGSDPEVLLRLRQSLPAERMSFLEFGALPWHEARKVLLGQLPFAEAARIYVDAGGHVGYMQELLRLRASEGFDDQQRLPLPQRIRAAYLLEATQLPEATRSVLDHLSVHPGALSDAVLHHLGFTEHLDILEMAGWLQYHGRWSFRDETTRRVIGQTVQTGRRLHYHMRFAEALASTEPEMVLEAAYHRAMACRQEREFDEGPVTPSERRMSTVRGAAPQRLRGVRGRETAILERHRETLHEVAEGDAWYWVREPLERGTSDAEFDLPGRPCLIRLRANVYHERLLGAAQGREVFPLRLWCTNGTSPERQVVLGDGAEATVLRGGTLHLPVHEAHDVSLVCDHRTLRVECDAEVGIVEFSLQAFEFTPGEYGEVQAFDLRARARDDDIAYHDEDGEAQER